jgi:DNA-binding MarR family transcriptional regulator
MTSGRAFDRDRIYREVVEMMEAGDHDRGGGVAPPALADHMGFHISTARRHLEALEEAGRLDKTMGVGPRRPRVSYLPAED